MKIDQLQDIKEKSFWIPKGLDNEDFIQELTYKQKCKCLYITNVIIKLSTFAAGYNDSDFVPLYSKQLQSVIGGKYKKYLRILKKNGVIRWQNGYSPLRGQSKRYALTNEYRNNPSLWMCRESDMLQRLQEWNCEHRQASLFYDTFPYTFVRRTLENSEIDAGRAIHSIRSNDSLRDSQKRARIRRVRNLEKKSFCLTVNQTNGRIQTPVTSLSSDSRKFLTVSGYRDTAYFDVSNSQPYMLSVLLNYITNRNRNIVQPYVNTTHRYFEHSSLGTIYETISEATGVEREEAKMITFKVLFSHPTQFEGLKEKFAEVYPNIFDFCVEYKSQNGYNQLAISLQSRESDMMLETLRCLGKENIPAVSIFDGIIVPEKFGSNAKNILKESFSVGSLSPTVHREF